MKNQAEWERIWKELRACMKKYREEQEREMEEYRRREGRGRGVLTPFYFIEIFSCITTKKIF